MSWEAFLQLLKKMFRICNWQSAPYTVAKHWAAKSVMHYRDPARGSWFSDEVQPTSEFSVAVAALAKRSKLVAALLGVTGGPPSAIRFLRSVTRGPDEVRLRDWVLMEQDGAPVMSGQVEQMVQGTYIERGVSFVRLWCTCCKEVYEDQITSDLWSDPGQSSKSMLVLFERMRVTVVTRSVNPVSDQFVI